MGLSSKGVLSGGGYFPTGDFVLGGYCPGDYILIALHRGDIKTRIVSVTPTRSCRCLCYE